VNESTEAPRALPWRPLAEALTRLYGLPSWSFKEFAFWQLPGDPAVYMAVAGAEPPASREALLNTGWAVLTASLPEGRPTLDLLGVIGPDANRNVIELDAAGAAEFLFRDARFQVPADADAPVLVVRHGRRVLGGWERETGRPLR